MCKTVTDKFNVMISKFSADFNLAVEYETYNNKLHKLIANKNKNLIQDIELLNELATGIRLGNIIIMEKE